MNLAAIKTWATAHKPAVLAGGAASAGAGALYVRHRNASSSPGSATPTGGGPTAGLGGAPDTTGTDLQNAVQDQLNTQTDYVNGLIAAIRRQLRATRKQLRAAQRANRRAHRPTPQPHQPRRHHKPKPTQHYRHGRLIHGGPAPAPRVMRAAVPVRRRRHRRR